MISIFARVPRLYRRIHFYAGWFTGHQFRAIVFLEEWRVHSADHATLATTRRRCTTSNDDVEWTLVSKRHGICAWSAIVIIWHKIVFVQTCTQSPCAWRAQWPGFNSARARPLTKEFSNNSYAHDEHRNNPGQKKGSTVSSINCDRCRHLDLAMSCLPAAPAWIEVNRLGRPLAGVIHSASQG